MARSWDVLLGGQKWNGDIRVPIVEIRFVVWKRNHRRNPGNRMSVRFNVCALPCQLFALFIKLLLCINNNSSSSSSREREANRKTTMTGQTTTQTMRQIEMVPEESMAEVKSCQFGCCDFDFDLDAFLLLLSCCCPAIIDSVGGLSKMICEHNTLYFGHC